MTHNHDDNSYDDDDDHNNENNINNIHKQETHLNDDNNNNTGCFAWAGDCYEVVQQTCSLPDFERQPLVLSLRQGAGVCEEFLLSLCFSMEAVRASGVARIRVGTARVPAVFAERGSSSLSTPQSVLRCLAL